MNDLKFLSKKYDELYNEAKEIFKRNNPCKFENGLCIRERQRKEEDGIYSPYCCCGHPDGILERKGVHCKHFIEGKGCSVKCLMCVTWICDNSLFENKKDLKRLEKIADEAYNLNLFHFRLSKEETMKIILEDMQIG